MASASLLASNEFGFPAVDFSSSSSASSPGTTVAAVEKSAKGVWYQHPIVALAGVVITTGILLERSTRPVARARLEGNVGPAQGSIEGSV